ncbi:MAG: polysaccharide biosynthesis/export family protein [Thermodesulfobacteriota bacterium]
MVAFRGKEINVYILNLHFGWIFVTFLLLSLLISCASDSPHKKATTLRESQTKERDSSKQVKIMNERILMGSLSLTSKRSATRDYRIGPEDLLEISVYEDEKLNKTVRVSSQGDISLPLLGVLKVEGLTAVQLEREIRDLLSERLYQNPHVSVFIKEYRSQRISVIGAVEKPGIYDVMGQKTVLEGLSLAGGLKEDAGQLLFLIRPPPSDEETSKNPEASGERMPETLVIDLEELLVKGNLSLNLPLKHGDVINVSFSGKVFVGGEVNRPGGFYLKGRRMTVSQAIAMAEGLKPKANASGTVIFRYGQGDEEEVLPVDVNAIHKGESKDVYLRENDIVIVPKSGAKAFLIELRETLKGIFGLGFSLGSL